MDSIFSSKRKFEVVFYMYIKSTLSTMDTAGTVLKRCPSYTESDKESKDRNQLWVSVLQVSVTRESTVVPIPSGVYTK